MGFQHMKPEYLEATSRKGGRWKLKKGLGAMDKDRAREIQSKGGITSRDNRRSGQIVKKEKGSSENTPILERILEDVSE